MASKISALTSAVPTFDDTLVVVDDIGGTPLSKRIDLTAVQTLFRQDFDTRTAAIAATIDTTTNFIRTAGYAASGDGGAALYDKVASEPPHDAKAQSADGAWWELVPEGGVVRAKQLGAVEGADITTSLQSTIDFALYGGTSGAPKAGIVIVDIHAGTLSNTIHPSYGRFNGTVHFAQLTVRGLGKAFSVSLGDPGTLLTSTVTDKPGWAITGGRNMLLEDLTLWGVARAGIDAISVSGTTPTVEANWNTKLTDVSVTVDRVFAPHAGIVVDAYTGTAPSPAYPDVTPPTWVDSSPVQYGKSASGWTTIRRVQLEGWEVAIVNSPADFTGNGDFTQIDYVSIRNCKYGISDGQSQSRNMRMLSPSFTKVFTLLTNNKHGKKVGRFAGEIIDLDGAGYIGQIFDFTQIVSVLGIAFRGLYCESLHRIGDFSGTNVAEGQMLFDQCSFDFRHAGKGVSPAQVMSGGLGEVVFRGGNMTLYNDCIAFKVSQLRIEGTRMLPTATSTKAYMQIFHNATQGGIVVLAASKKNYHIAARFQPYDLNAGTLRTQAHTVGDTFSLTSRDGLLPVWAPPCQRGSSQGDLVRAEGLVQNPRVTATDSAGADWTSESRTNRTIAFTTTGVSAVQDFNLQGYMPGDFIIDLATSSVMVIRSTATGTGVTAAELVTNWVDDGGSSFSTFETLSLTAGDKTMVQARCFTPPRRITGLTDTTAVTIVNIPTMTGATPTDYGLVIDDWLFEDAMEEDTYSTAGRAEVNGITTGSNLITLTGAASQIGTFTFDLWVKKAPTNDASR